VSSYTRLGVPPSTLLMQECLVAAKFDEYVWWMVIGVLGALTGVLIASVMVLRR